MKEVKFHGTVRPSSIRIQETEDFYKFYRQILNGDKGNNLVEITIRICDKRQEWIDKYYNLAKRMANAGTYVIKHCKEVCYVIPCGYAGDAASATPRHGDKYDYKTGVAVAFAKAFGDKVPEYI